LVIDRWTTETLAADPAALVAIFVVHCFDPLAVYRQQFPAIQHKLAEGAAVVATEISDDPEIDVVFDRRFLELICSL
jgi:hypothetical protein